MQIWKFVSFSLAAAGGLLMAAAGVGPEDAVSNLAQWAGLLGLDNVPNWLADKDADSWGMVLGIAIVTTAAIMILRLWFVSRQPITKKNKQRVDSGSHKRPAFDLYDKARAILRRTHVLGTPHNLVKASGEAQFVSEDGVFVGADVQHVDYPSPSGVLSKISNDELRSRVRLVAANLNALQEESDGNPVQWDINLDELERHNTNMRSIFITRFHKEAFELLAEIMNRLPAEKRRQLEERKQLPLEFRLGIDAIILGNPTGPAPYAGAALLLAAIAEALPNDTR